MPQVFKIGSYCIYFWVNEGKPLEPIHIHIANGKPRQNAAKVWITRTGKCLYAGNPHPDIEDHTLRNIMRIVEARSAEIMKKWYEYFGSIEFYC